MRASGGHPRRTSKRPCRRSSVRSTAGPGSESCVMLDDDRSPVWAAGQLHDGDHRRADVVQDWPPGVAVRVYERLLFPPVEAGTFQGQGRAQRQPVHPTRSRTMHARRASPARRCGTCRCHTPISMTTTRDGDPKAQTSGSLTVAMKADQACRRPPDSRVSTGKPGQRQSGGSA